MDIKDIEQNKEQGEQIQDEQIQDEQIQDEQIQDEQIQNEQIQDEQIQDEQIQNEQIQIEQEQKNQDSLEQVTAAQEQQVTLQNDSLEKKNTTLSMKEKMQRVINASKKLDDITVEDDKKIQMKEKLANVSKMMNEESMQDDTKEASKKSSKAEGFLSKNASAKAKLEEMRLKLNFALEDEQQEKNQDSFEQVPVTQEQPEQEQVAQEQQKQEQVPAAQEQQVVQENEQIQSEQIQSEQIQNEQIQSEQIQNEQIQSEQIQSELNNQKIESKNEFEEITKDLKEELPELKEVKVKNKNSKWHQILDFIIKTMNGMAHGLFATLIIGTIIGTIGSLFNDGTVAKIALTNIGTCLKNVTGVGIGLGIAWSLGYKDLKLISLGAAGALTAWFCSSSLVENVGDFAYQIGDPLTIYLVVIAVAILMKYVLSKKTPIDIIIVPLFACLLSAALTILISKYTVYITTAIGSFIGVATEYQPILMGIVISVVMGMALTAPISSAAIAATIFTEAAFTNNPYVAIAGGAALIGCCTQMLGFAIQSRKDNGIGTVFAIGIGTSMLQFKNILKKPIIWLPTIIASAILGPISTTIIQMKCMGTACGMGTSGLVGQIGFIASYGTLDFKAWLILIGFQFICPLVLVYLIDLLFRSFKWIKKGDFKL